MSTLNWGDMLRDSSAAGQSFEPLPDSIYDLKIIEATAAKTSAGKSMFKITTEVQTGQYARRRIWGNIVVSPENPNALRFFFDNMAALGIPKDWFSQEPSDEQVASVMQGRTFRGQIGRGTGNYSDKNEIKKYLPATTAAPTASAAPAAQAAPAPAPAPAPATSPQPQAAPAPAPAPAAPAAPAAPEPSSPWDGNAAPSAPPGSPF